MKILDRYLYTKIIVFSISSLIALGFIFGFFKYLEELNNIGIGAYNSLSALKYIIYLFPSILNTLIILSLMMGSVFAIGNLNSNSELQIFYTASYSSTGLIVKILKFLFGFSVILIILGESISPISIKFSSDYKNQQLEKNISFVRRNFWLKNDQSFLYLERKDNSDFHSVRLFDIEDLDLKTMVIFQDPTLKSNLLESSSVEKKTINLKDKFFEIASSNEINQSIEIPLNNDDLETIHNDEKTMSIMDLIKVISYSIDSHTDYRKYAFELISRLVKPLTLIGMLLIALPYIFSVSRTISTGKKVFLAITIGIVTHLLTKFSYVISINVESMEIFGPIVPAFFLICIGIFLLYNRSGKTTV